MNILHLHTSLNITCGISKTIYLITKYQGEKNRHFVIAIGGDAKEKFLDSGINVTLLSLKRNSFFGIYKTVNFLIRYIKEKKIDIIHSHHRFFDFISYIISFLIKVKRVTSVQSFGYGKKSFSYKSPILLAAGESVKEHLENYFKIKEEKIIVFNNFIDINEISEKINSKSIKEEFGVPENSYLVGYVGRFSVAEKGIDIIINAFKDFNERHSNSYLLMIGEGEDINKINIPQNVIIVSVKRDIFDCYGIFDCLVLPSRVDPFPLTVLEAGMMRVPFIGADVNGISEIIDNNYEGLLFEKENVKDLIEKMELYFNDKNFAEECAENLYKKVISNYNQEKAMDLLDNIYNKL